MATHDLHAVKNHLNDAKKAEKLENHAEKEEHKAEKQLEKAQKHEGKLEQELASAQQRHREAINALEKERAHPPVKEKIETKEYKAAKKESAAEAAVEKAKIAVKEAEERLHLKQNQHQRQAGRLDSAMGVVGGDQSHFA